MKYSRTFIAAVALVVALGLVAPSSFGGTASADVPPDKNKHAWPAGQTLECDLDGDNIYDDVSYEVVTTWNAATFQVVNSSITLTSRRWELTSTNIPVDDPDADPWVFTDSGGPGSEKAQKKGLQDGLVPCKTTFTGVWEVDGVEYNYSDEFTYSVSIHDGSVHAASADEQQTTVRQHQHKSKHGGKHRHGKRGR